MFYSKEEKELLGRYFKYYRENEKFKIKDITSAGICGYHLYKKIEEGQIKNNDELYDDLLSFYNIDVEVLIQLREIKSYIHELYDACEWYDNERIYQLTKKIRKKFNHVSNKPIIKEIVYSLNIIEDFYLKDNYLNEKEIIETLQLISLWNNDLSSLLVEVCEKSNMVYVFSLELFDLIKPFTLKEDNISRYWYANDCVVRVNNLEATEIYLQLYEHYNQKKNSLRKARVLMDLHALYRDTDYKKAKEYTIYLEELSLDESLPKVMKEAIYYNLGMYYYLKGDYENALLNYEKSNEITEDMLSILFICACRSQLNRLIGYEFNLDPNHALSLYLKYFQMKANEATDKELEKYICDCLINILMDEKYEQPFWKMFEYEMGELVRFTRNYKKYLKFQEKMKFATKNAA